MTAWLSVIGIGDNGRYSLLPAARRVLDDAEVVVAAKRHLEAMNLQVEVITWPSPFDHMLDKLVSLRGRRAVVLATGDPLWHSVGEKLAHHFDAEEISFFPQLSAYQLAAARLGWSMADCQFLTTHGRPIETIIPFVQPDNRLIILTNDGKTPKKIADMLTDRGFGASKLTCFAHMDGAKEECYAAMANEWSKIMPDFNTLAVEVVANVDAAIVPQTIGLSDVHFTHDGRMTKQVVRAATLAKLMPARNALLWDIGAGCGSISVEWMRAAHGAHAVAIEPLAERRAMIAQNATSLGTPQIEIIDGKAPDCLEKLDAPNAIFIGGGTSESVIRQSLDALKPFGRLVVNAVTLESEAVLLKAFADHGGALVRIDVANADPVGKFTGWRPNMPVTQWSLIKK
ncbi:MAG: precorrin-6y C5,15-methyltransferase (decarboxylating) subunit CbiE [Pseudomonadota bacterium]